MATREKPAQARYKSENHRLKNKIRKLTRYVKLHQNDKSSANRLQELITTGK